MTAAFSGFMPERGELEPSWFGRRLTPPSWTGSARCTPAHECLATPMAGCFYLVNRKDLAPIFLTTFNDLPKNENGSSSTNASNARDARPHVGPSITCALVSVVQKGRARRYGSYEDTSTCCR